MFLVLTDFFGRVPSFGQDPAGGFDGLLMGGEQVVQVVPGIGGIGGCGFLGLLRTLVVIDSTAGTHAENIVGMCLGGENIAALITDSAVVCAVVYNGLMLMPAIGGGCTAGADTGGVVTMGLIEADDMAFGTDHLMVGAGVHGMMVRMLADPLVEGVGSAAVTQMGEEVIAVVLGGENNFADITGSAVVLAVVYQTGILVCAFTLADGADAIFAEGAVISVGYLAAVTGAGVGGIVVGCGILGGMIAGVFTLADGAQIISTEGALAGVGYLAAVALAGVGAVIVGCGILGGMIAGVGTLADGAQIIITEGAVAGGGSIAAVTLAGMGTITVGGVILNFVFAHLSPAKIAAVTGYDGSRTGLGSLYIHFAGRTVDFVGAVPVGSIRLPKTAMTAVCGHGSHRQQRDQCCQYQKYGNDFCFHFQSTS